MAVELLAMRNLLLFQQFRLIASACAISLFLSGISERAWCDDVSTPSAPSAVEPQVAPPATVSSPSANASTPPANTATGSPVVETEPAAAPEIPWDFSPYRVQIWIASDDSRVTADQLSQPLAEYLDRDFAAIWRLSISDAPLSVRAAASRGLGKITYDSVTSADPVIALKRNHVDAPRIRFVSDVATYVKKCLATSGRIAEVTQRGKAVGNEGLSGVAKLLEAVEGDSLAVVEKWADPAVEAIITNRGMAKDLKDPPAKLISLPIDNLAAETIEASDKLFIVHVETERLPWTVSVVELDCLMRNFSVVHQRTVASPRLLVSVMGQTITEVFAPLIRIEDAGAKNAKGLVRAHGLITAEKSPASVAKDDFFVPMTRKNDRNGDPIQIGPLDWAFLHVKEVNGPKIEMDYHAGKAGGLQGRQNKRTFRTATRVRPFDGSTTVRLHVQRNPSAPLVGYEIYERGLSSTEMKFVGRTNWDGRIDIPKSDLAMRLLYVKNGGAVLARLPVVPGQSELEVADLFGDDQRLRAEAYIRGTQNSIVDLVAIRQLFAARIRMRLKAGQLQEAKDLLESLRNEPTYEKIAGDMGRKLLQLKGRNSGEQSKIDRMFAQTREMLVKNISPTLIRELEEAVIAAEKGTPAKPASTAETAATEAN
ncbi:MAG TPA: hypothetical protein DDZ51_01695 [Planctomycetaceae bacterium]|nr:hypothetical protein [Planctomycetaceae bacterium]